MNVNASQLYLFRQMNPYAQKRNNEASNLLRVFYDQNQRGQNRTMEDFRKDLKDLYRTDQRSMQNSYDYASRIANDRLQYANSLSTARTKSKNTTNELKKLNYNFKAISAQIIRSKTSNAARQAASKARAEVARLKRLRKGNGYDDEELQYAIAHAQAMERVAKKKVKHLLEEEMIHVTDEQGLSGRVEPIDVDEEVEEVEEASQEELSDELTEEMAQEMEDAAAAEEEIMYELMQSVDELSAMQEMMADAMEEMLTDMDITDMLDDLMDVVDFKMTEADFKMLKTKHRTKEMKEIVKADAEYLKAMFGKYQADMNSASSGAVSMPSGGDAAPVVSVTPEMSAMPAMPSGGIDFCV